MKDFPVIKITILFALGILFEKIFCVQLEQILILTGLLVLVTFLYSYLSQSNSDIIKSVFIALLVLSAGAASYSFSVNSLKPYPFKVPKIKEAVIYGKITNIELDRSYEIRVFVDTDSLRVFNETVKLPYSILCRFRDEKRKRLDSLYDIIKVGNIVKLTGTFTMGREERNPGEFDYQKYLVTKGISGILNCYNAADVKIISHQYDKFGTFIFHVRKAIDKKISSLHNEETAGLLKGLILADKSEVSYESQTDFINTGVVHILAVSGSNVALILLIFQILVGRFNLMVRSVLSLLCIIAFLLITGPSPSVVRAAIMGMVVIAAFVSNRSRNLFNLLSISALIILVLNPLDLFDPGFQLSFSAVLSIIILVPFFQNMIRNWNIRNNIIKNIILIVFVSLSAQIGTLPFTLYYFGKLSVVSLLSNLIVVPVIGLITGIGFFTLALAVLSNYSADFFAAANELLSRFIFYVTHYMSSFKYSYLSIRSFSIFDAVTFYIFIAVFFSFYGRFTSLKSRVLLVLFILCDVILLCSLDDKKILPDNVLSVLTIDVGQGDAILIKFPDNKTALIDAGEANQYFDNGERVIIPLLDYLGIKKIEYGFISHIDSDHYSGFFSLVENDRIGKVLKPAIDTTLTKDVKFENYLKKRNIPVSYYNRQALKIGGGRLYILNKTTRNEKHMSSNNSSGVMKICYRKNSFIFTGDLGFAGEKFLRNTNKILLGSDVLKVSHHGSKYGTSRGFLSIVRPKVSIISAGVLNKFKHPAPETIRRLREINSKILRTDDEGAILLQSDGVKIRKVNWREL